MSIKLHHLLRIFTYTIFITAVFVIIYLLVIVEDKPAPGYIIASIAFFLGMLAPHLIKKYVPVVCPKCDGRSYAVTSAEGRLCFECSKCGYVHKTTFIEGSSGEVS
jgi:hypothetical protein